MKHPTGRNALRAALLSEHVWLAHFSLVPCAITNAAVPGNACNVQVLFSKFGFAFTELEVSGDEFLLLKEHDIIGIMPRAQAIADDIPELKPLGDRVLVHVDEVGEISSGGLMLPESAREKPVSGKVVRTGPGKREEDGNITPMSVKAGDTVVYFKYAGDNMETTDGSKYVVLHQQDILCRA
jgi:chaperonin GroES